MNQPYGMAVEVVTTIAVQAAVFYILAGAPVPVCQYSAERQRTVVTPNDGRPAFFPSRLMAYRLTVHGVARDKLLPRFRGWGPIRSHPTLTSLK